ncbi:DUF3742 family protein [Pseudomonas sp. B329]|uniref:DUF3742 family protein n=1 Tax=Pseudomonas sp. B329 TaxID=1553459 RepID=UPI0020069163|nr:DUF3742 family protein [Pseudomonas sp. B329]MCK3864215.1 DUF3742 family protein [Pseudomonas sp. B329]
MRKKEFTQLFGSRLANVYKIYSRLDAAFARWLKGRGMPAIVVIWVVRVLKVLSAGVLLYVAFWVTLVFVGFFGLLAFLRFDDSDEDPVAGFQSEKLFPDHHSPKNSHDSKFD